MTFNTCGKFNSVCGGGGVKIISFRCLSLFKAWNEVTQSPSEEPLCTFAPKVWNDLPDEIRSAPSLASFRKKLKTYLFTKAYPP